MLLWILLAVCFGIFQFRELILMSYIEHRTLYHADYKIAILVALEMEAG